jgi:hypothetical protein
MIVALVFAIDAVSPMTAAGVEKPQGLDWPPEVRAQPAAKPKPEVAPE